MKRILMGLVSAAALWTAACSSGGGQNIPPPPPAGQYSNASLSGQYAFVTSGEILTGTTFASIARVGSFTADGQGHITGGVEDVNAEGQVTNAVAITGGTYTVHADGRGFMNLIFGQTSIDFGIVLTSTSDGLLIDETANSAQAFPLRVLPVLMFSTLPDWMQASNLVARAMSPSSANSSPAAG
jgi:hypothetical protein